MLARAVASRRDPLRAQRSSILKQAIIMSLLPVLNCSKWKPSWQYTHGRSVHRSAGNERRNASSCPEAG